MGVSWVVAAGFGTAVAAQLLLCGWLARRYATIPAKIPYGSIGNDYFWYGPRAIVWSAPVSFLVILAFVAAEIAAAPDFVRAQPALALPFFLMAAVTPLMARSINEKVGAARQREQQSGQG